MIKAVPQGAFWVVLAEVYIHSFGILMISSVSCASTCDLFLCVKGISVLNEKANIFRFNFLFVLLWSCYYDHLATQEG